MLTDNNKTSASQKLLKVCFYFRLFSNTLPTINVICHIHNLKICKNTNITVNKMRYPIRFQIYEKSMSTYFIADATFLSKFESNKNFWKKHKKDCAA